MDIHTWKEAGALMSIIERTACAVTGATRSLSTMNGISTACAVCGTTKVEIGHKRRRGADRRHCCPSWTMPSGTC